MRALVFGLLWLVACSCTGPAASSPHIPGLDAKWGEEVWKFLQAHPQP